MRLILLFIFTFISISSSHAALKVDINQGNVEPIPVAINDFLDASGGVDSIGTQIREIVENDLQSSGLFRPISQSAFLEKPAISAIPKFLNWRQIGSLGVTTGRILKQDNNITVEFRLWDPNLEKQIEGASFTLPEAAYRRAAHKIADQIYHRITGEAGYFDSRLLFISESGSFKKRIKKLAIMDQDGANYKELTDGKDLVLTPRFDPKLHRAIYMSYKNRVPQVYILDIGTGEQRLLGNFPGMSFAPRFAPDKEAAIMSIAKDGTTDVYEVDISSGSLRKLTGGVGTINTSPSYSPDGKNVVFTSDRGGRPQLYVMSRNGGEAKRISFGDGSYTAPVWSPRGDFIAFAKQKGGQFYIGVMRTDGTGERLLTTSWMDEGPTWSPNGRVIIFSRQKMGAGYQLFAIDLTGHNERKITTPTDASDPTWSSLLG